MKRRNEIITPETAILADQAADINPLNLSEELDGFLGEPSCFSIKRLVEGIMREAYSTHPDAASYAYDSFGDFRGDEDTVSKFPVIPLSRLPDFERLTIEMVRAASYPEPKHSFSPQDDLNKMIARSDSKVAHEALVHHIIRPFPQEHRKVFDGPDEMTYKAGIINEFFDAVTYHGTPDTNPLATQSLVEIYQATRAGAPVSEQAHQQDERQMSAIESSPAIGSIGDLQDSMMARFMAYPHPVFDAVVQETLDQEPVSEKRFLMVIETLLGRRRQQRQDSYYDDIASQVIAPYDKNVAELVALYMASAYERGDEAEAARDMIERALTERIITVELTREKNLTSESANDNSLLLQFAVKRHPFGSVYIGDDESDESKTNKTLSYEYDLQYLLGLVSGQNSDGVRELTAWRIATGFKDDALSGRDRAPYAKLAYMTMADTVLSADPAGYERVDSRATQHMMWAMGDIVGRAPLMIDLLTHDELARLVSYREAHNCYAENTYVSEQRDDERRSDARGVDRSFQSLFDLIHERSQWLEIQASPKAYVKWMSKDVRGYARSVRDSESRHNDLTITLQEQARRAKELAKKSESGEEVSEDIVRLVAECTVTRREYASSRRYDSGLRARGLQEAVFSLHRNLPLPLKGTAIQLIEAGEIPSYISDKGIASIRQQLAAAEDA